MVRDTAYYEILGLSETASQDEIKRAYKQKARQHHPDKVSDQSIPVCWRDDPSAHETFQKIGQAYETLSNPDDRAWYDSNGPSSRPDPSMGGPPDMDDLFAQMFGGGGFSFGGPGGAGASFDTRGGQPKGPRRGRDFDIAKEISLENAYMGKTIHVKLERNKLCGQCKGTGGKKGGVKVKCGRCAGKGNVFEDRQLAPGMIGKAMVPCPSCHGEKERFAESHRCSKCKGTCVTKSSRTVEVVIEPGTAHGERICLKGQADEAPNTITGDVIFHIHVLPHPLFSPSNSPHRPHDLTIAITISLSEALLGFNRVMFQHLDGRGIRLISPKGQRVVRHGDELVVACEGMPKPGAAGKGAVNRGDLRVKVGVEMPDPSWAMRQPDILYTMLTQQDGTVRLPPTLDDISPLPAVIEERYLSDAR